LTSPASYHSRATRTLDSLSSYRTARSVNIYGPEDHEASERMEACFNALNLDDEDDSEDLDRPFEEDVTFRTAHRNNPTGNGAASQQDFTEVPLDNDHSSNHSEFHSASGHESLEDGETKKKDAKSDDDSFAKADDDDCQNASDDDEDEESAHSGNSNSFKDDDESTIDMVEQREKQVRRSLLFCILSALGVVLCGKLISKLIQRCRGGSNEDDAMQVAADVVGADDVIAVTNTNAL